MEYKRQQDVLNYEKLEDMLEGMPEFMRIFVDGCREDIMSSRSIIGYVGDLNTFFYYLEKRLHLKKSELTIRTLEELTPLELSGFKGFLQAYEKDGTIYQNGKAAINRKLVAVRQLYERLYNLDLIEKDPSRKLEFIPWKAEDRERHVIALDHQEVRELKDTVRRGTGLTQSQISHNRVNELRDDAIITLLLYRYPCLRVCRARPRGRFLRQKDYTDHPQGTDEDAGTAYQRRGQSCPLPLHYGREKAIGNRSGSPLYLKEGTAYHRPFSAAPRPEICESVRHGQEDQLPQAPFHLWDEPL